MAEGDTFGSGLNFNAGDPATGAASNFGQVPQDAGPDAPPMQAGPGPQPERSGVFGSGLSLGGPRYSTDPQATALDQSESLLNQRIQRASQISSNPLAAFLNPEAVQAARTFVPQATEQLQKIQQQRAQIAAGKQQADSLGLAPGEVSDQATQADRVEFAQNKALKGDLRVFQGLQAVDPKAAEAIQDRVHEAVAGHLTNAQYAFDSLAGMQNQGQYAAKLNELRQKGTLGDLETLGLKVPPSFDAFNASKASEGKALREARIGIDTVRQKLEERNTLLPMEEKEAKTYAGAKTTAYGDQITNGYWARRNADGTRAFVVNGAADPRDLGKNFTYASPEQRKALEEESDKAVPKEEREKYRAFNRTYQLATTDAKGNPVGEGKINTNPNVQQGIAEGLASMLRGGAGGANIGLLRIETSKRGFIQGLIDKISTEKGAVINELKGKDVNPYLSTLTQQQVRDVMDVLKQYNDKSIGDRIAPIAQRAGALGLDTAAIGYGGKETAGTVSDALEAGRQAQIARDLPQHQAIGAGNGAYLLGAQRPGSGATALPPGTAPTTQLSGPPLQTPVQQATQPVPQSPGSGPAPGPNQPGLTVQPGGSGPGAPAPPAAPVTIAGQQVSVPLPKGASPNFVPNLQRIESGNERDPWSAGTKGSSASGAFQFINSTWAADKPPGAPDRAGDASPEQQAQALATHTAKNAASLQAAGVPVNDTNLYVAHNLGAGGASSLLKADPKADARTIVGEAAARNNPMFFRGRPTVATALARYEGAMNGTLDTKGGTASTFDSRLSQLMPGLRPSQPAKDLAANAVDYAPAIGGTAGAVIGGAAGGIPGAMAGGAAGSAAGNRLRNYAQGNEQSLAQDAKQAALGGILGIVPEGRPLAGAAMRAAGVGGVEAGAEAAQGGGAGDVVEAGAKGIGYALGGELLGRFVSSAGATAYKALSRYTQTAQADLSAQAGKLADARKVLETEQPKLPGEGSGANPKYEAAKKAADDATAAIKDHGQNPDDMVHAYEQAKAGVSAGEAAVTRKAASEQRNVGAGYNQLRTDVKEAGVGVPKANQPVPNGPAAQLRTAENPAGKVPEQFRPEAEHAEMLIKAPAKDWGEKWQQLQDAGSELIQKRLSFLANNDKPSADAMNALFQGVRNQQKAAAEYVFGKEQGAKVITKLEGLDTRYAKIMNATQGMNYEKMRGVLASGNTPAARELEKNFREFAKDDPGAIRAFNAMKAGARGDWKSEAALMAPVIMEGVLAATQGLSGLHAALAPAAVAVGAQRLYKLVQGYMNAKVLGKAVMFKDFLAEEIRKPEFHSAAQRAVVQGVAQ